MWSHANILVFATLLLGSTTGTFGAQSSPSSVSSQSVQYDSDPSYDHQTKVYQAQFSPSTSSAQGGVEVFFSPDWSIQSLTDMIEEIPAGGTLDIGTPGWSSWNNCTWTQDDDFYPGECKGCSIDVMRDDPFPVFGAVLNAVHRGVHVRVLTNDYGTTTCHDEITPLEFLKLNNVDVKYYASTTYWHAKYMNANNQKTSVSSVNFSQDSFMKNREAGVILVGQSVVTARTFYASVFEHDWNNGFDLVINRTFTSEQMKRITNPAPITINMPNQPDFPGSYVTPKPTDLGGSGSIQTFVSPDFARPTMFDDMQSAKKSFEIFIYQITDKGICDELVSTIKRGVNVTVLVSARIFSYYAWKEAQVCYKQLSYAGTRPRLTPSYYDYSHQKYWIVDGEAVGLSTGNWSPTDFPTNTAGDNKYPPYSQSGWQDTNRDMNIKISNPNVVEVFQTTFNEDFARGKWWYSAPQGVNGVRSSGLRGA